MEAELCRWLAKYPLTVELGMGLVIGAMASFAVLFIFTRLAFSLGERTREVLWLLPRLVKAAVLSSLLRVFVLILPVTLAALILWKWVLFALLSSAIPGCPRGVPWQWGVLIGVPVALLVMIQYWVLVFLLDSHLGFKIRPLESRAWMDRFQAEFADELTALEEGFVTHALLAQTSSPRVSSYVVYGGIGVRPRVVFSKKFVEKLKAGGEGPFLSRMVLEILARHRKKDLFFEVFLQGLVGWSNVGRWLCERNSRWCHGLDHLEIMKRVGACRKDRLRHLSGIRWMRPGAKVLATLLFILLGAQAFRMIQVAWVYHRNYEKQQASKVKPREEGGTGDPVQAPGCSVGGAQES